MVCNEQGSMDITSAKRNKPQSYQDFSMHHKVLKSSNIKIVRRPIDRDGPTCKRKYFVPSVECHVTILPRGGETK